MLVNTRKGETRGKKETMEKGREKVMGKNVC